MTVNNDIDDDSATKHNDSHTLLELGAGPLLKLSDVCPGESIEHALPDCATSLSTLSCNRVRYS